MGSFLSQGMRRQKKKERKKERKKRTANGPSSFSFYKDGEEGARGVQGLTSKIEL